MLNFDKQYNLLNALPASVTSVSKENYSWNSWLSIHFQSSNDLDIHWTFHWVALIDKEFHRWGNMAAGGIPWTPIVFFLRHSSCVLSLNHTNYTEIEDFRCLNASPILFYDLIRSTGTSISSSTLINRHPIRGLCSSPGNGTTMTKKHRKRGRKSSTASGSATGLSQ